MSNEPSAQSCSHVPLSVPIMPQLTFHSSPHQVHRQSRRMCVVSPSRRSLLPEIQTGNHVLPSIIFVRVENLETISKCKPNEKNLWWTNLSSTRVKHPDILACDDVTQLTGLNVANLNEIRLKCQDVGVIEREGLRRALPIDSPVLSCSPSITIDEK